MQQVIRLDNSDKILLIGLSIHLIVGWMLVGIIGGEGYLIAGSLILFVGLILYLLQRYLWHKLIKYPRYFLLLSLISCTMYLKEVCPNMLIPDLHMIVVIVVSTFYLTPLLIWLVFACYVVFQTIFFIKISSFVSTSTIQFALGVIFVFFIVIALHKICLIYRDNMNRIRKLERDQNFERMGQQQHLATIGQIAASIAHDIRNPLTSIQGFVQLIEKNELRGTYSGYYKIIRSEISRIDTLLREVLVLSKSHTADAESWELVHLDGLLERLVVLMEPDALKSNIQIRLHLIKNPVVMGSEEKLQQVFMNLLRNAFEAVSESGRIDIILSEEAGEAVIQFQDTGTGIPEDKMEHLFTPFFTTKLEGTGLGLSICQSIIKAYEGEIHVRNLPECGAEFSVTLPI
ncbi:MAG: two-component sensor histidine kinase [Bacilli bacterium]|nr:two-component sensor histidine kinase [Bacilli bacterium]